MCYNEITQNIFRESQIPDDWKFTDDDTLIHKQSHRPLRGSTRAHKHRTGKVTMVTYVFHIYRDGKCIHNNLNEESFQGLMEYYVTQGVEVDYETCEVKTAGKSDVCMEPSY